MTDRFPPVPQSHTVKIKDGRGYSDMTHGLVKSWNPEPSVSALTSLLLRKVLQSHMLQRISLKQLDALTVCAQRKTEEQEICQLQQEDDLHSKSKICIWFIF